MDGWVLTQIQLAQRQNLLTGPRLSPIQHYASYMLDILDHLEKKEKESRELKLALLASGRIDDLSTLFDEFKDIITDDEAEFDEGVDDEGDPINTTYDYSNVQLDRPQEEVEREIREMLERASQGTATFESMEFSDWI